MRSVEKYMPFWLNKETITKELTDIYLKHSKGKSLRVCSSNISQEFFRK